MAEARYFLHIRDNGRLIEDPEGLLLADLEAARAHAAVAAVELMAEGLLNGELTAERGFHLVDEDGNLRQVLPFSELLEAAGT